MLVGNQISRTIYDEMVSTRDAHEGLLVSASLSLGWIDSAIRLADQVKRIEGPS